MGGYIFLNPIINSTASQCFHIPSGNRSGITNNLDLSIDELLLMNDFGSQSDDSLRVIDWYKIVSFPVSSYN